MNLKRRVGRLEQVMLVTAEIVTRRVVISNTGKALDLKKLPRERK